MEIAQILSKPRVYVETSVISYACSRANINPVLSARCASSVLLLGAHDIFDLYASFLVTDECRVGDQDAAQRRMQCVAAIPLIESTPDELKQIESVAGQLLALKVFPDKSYIDAAHIAFCCVHGIELIASWNFKHIASPWARQRITTALESLKLFTPLIATPDELLEGV